VPAIAAVAFVLVELLLLLFSNLAVLKTKLYPQ
jgi:hypothetical protein